MKNKKLVLAMSAGLIILIALFSALFILNRPDTEQGSKQIGVTVVFADKSEKEYTIKTDAEYLADALLEEKIIEEKSKDGMYTVIAGERADYTLDGSWWCLSVNGEMASVGINDQPVTDGENYELTNTPS
ncbi:MAG: DUF4430 domain-containing protein [Clostridia bacterium]|nr:DUF4430 domain-containing protein [Clostridia bacterium]